MLQLRRLQNLSKKCVVGQCAPLYNDYVETRSRSTGLAHVKKLQRQSHSVPRRWRSTLTSGHQRPSYIFHQGSVPLRDQTVGKLLEQAANRWPNRECLVSTHQNIRLTLGEARRRADKIAAGLRKLGLEKGDRVGIWGPNQVEWFLTFLACARGGFIQVGINPAFQPTELEYCVQKVGIRAVISPENFKTQNYAEMLLSAKRKCPTLEHIIICSDKNIHGTRRFADVESLSTNVEMQAIAVEQEEISPNSGFNIQFTSGTTGRPKATLLSHRSIVNNSRQAAQRSELDTAHHKICMHMPFFHAFGLLMAILAPLHTGAVMVLAGPSFKAKNSLETIVREKCTVLYGTPTMWVDMLNTQNKIHAPIENIFTGTTGGSPSSPELFKRIRETFHFDNMKSIFGMTETTGVCFQSLPGESKELAETTVGHLSDHVEAQVVDDKGVPVPFGAPGELWIRGYNNMIGYWGDEENTHKIFTDDGWLKTGDQFILRQDGYGHVVGRIKDMIIRGGENIFPREIEDFLETHPNVLEAHAFGVHDDRLGEETCVCVRLKGPNSNITAESFKNFARGKIAHFKIPKYIVFMEEFPKTASGKIQKHILREALEARGTIPTRPKY